MANDDCYNLTREGWIPCARLDGTVEKLSLLDVLLRSQELSGIVHYSAIVPVSVLRVLLAILHRVFGPRTQGEWKALWDTRTLPEQPIRDYFAKWEHRFNLFDGERPFYQDPTLKNIAVKVTINRLFHQNASGNNATLFDHSLDDDEAGVPNDEVALQLIAAQTFAIGGLVTPDPSALKESKSAEGSPTVKAVLFSVLGRTLRETLLLNLDLYDPAAGNPFGNVEDCPAWERAKACCLVTRTPQGRTDLLTWQPRRVLVFSDNSRHGQVRELAIMKGEQVPESFDLRGKDGMVGWKQLKAAAKKDVPAWAELSFRQDRAVWRDAHSLYSTDDASVSRPSILNWVGKLADDVLDPDVSFALDASGLGTDRAKIRSWHSETLPLPGRILNSPRLLEQIRRSQKIADKSAEVLNESTGTLARVLLRAVQPENTDTNAAAALSNSLSRREHFWSAMEGAFQRLVHWLVTDGEGAINDETGHSPALEHWFTECRNAAISSMSLTLNSAGNSARAYQAVATAESRFWRGITSVFSRAKRANTIGTK